MRLTHLWLTDFRCYESAEVEPAPGLTAVVGDNGHGKTSLLEAVGWLATARSFRGAADATLVMGGADQAVVRGEIERAGRTRLIEAAIARQGRNRIQVNRQAVPRAAALRESLRVTVFSPDDLDLVKGGPANRRRFLDDLATDTVPGAATAQSEYERVLRQRNALLRSGVRNDEDRFTLGVWDDQLVAKGADVIRARWALLGHLDGPLRKAYAELAAGSSVMTAAGAYEPSWEPEAAGSSAAPDAEPEGRLREAVERLRKQEIDRGQTLVGPHRDEWRLAVGGLDARTHASQGEQRSLALALRLAGHRVVTDAVGESPVLLLDDVFSELDPHRTQALVDLLALGQAGQALVTTASVLPDHLPVALRLHVRDGRVVAE